MPLNTKLDLNLKLKNKIWSVGASFWELSGCVNFCRIKMWTWVQFFALVEDHTLFDQKGLDPFMNILFLKAAAKFMVYFCQCDKTWINVWTHITIVILVSLGKFTLIYKKREIREVGKRTSSTCFSNQSNPLNSRLVWFCKFVWVWNYCNHWVWQLIIKYKKNLWQTYKNKFLI